MHGFEQYQDPQGELRSNESSLLVHSASLSRKVCGENRRICHGLAKPSNTEVFLNTGWHCKQATNGALEKPVMQIWMTWWHAGNWEFLPDESIPIDSSIGFIWLFLLQLPPSCWGLYYLELAQTSLGSQGLLAIARPPRGKGLGESWCKMQRIMMCIDGFSSWKMCGQCMKPCFLNCWSWEQKSLCLGAMCTAVVFHETLGKGLGGDDRSDSIEAPLQLCLGFKLSYG